MTFLATFLDLIPMAIGLFGTRGSEANVPLARAVVGGLLTSTCLTLFVVPIMYTLLMQRPAAAGAGPGGGAGRRAGSETDGRRAQRQRRRGGLCGV